MAAICAASVGEMRPGRKATRNFSRSVTSVSMPVASHASSHHAPAGVRAASKPSCSALRAIWPRYPSEAGRMTPAEPVATPWPPPTMSRPSPLVGRNQWKCNDIPSPAVSLYFQLTYYT